MRVLDIGTNEHTEVFAVDERGVGNANHYYEIKPTKPDAVHSPFVNGISFQKGPIKENGINGVHNEDLIAIVMDRLQGFQSGDYACDANSMALGHLADALKVLRDRTNERVERGIEGTSKK